MKWTEEMTGMNLSEASQFAQSKNYTVRVMEKDGESLMGTMDLNPNRINVAVEGENEVVTRIMSIG